MVIEWLAFSVPLAAQTRFIAQDAAIWTPALASQAGFLGKEVWQDAADPTRLNLIIRWSTLAQWKAVPSDLLATTQSAFDHAMGTHYPVLVCLTYDVLAP